MIGVLHFPRAFFLDDVQKVFDDTYGEGVISLTPGKNDYEYYDEEEKKDKKAFTDFTLHYRLAPDSHLENTLKATDAYGDKFSWTQKFDVDEIPLYHRKASIQ